ncbi:MAG: lipoyl synthase [Phycisphaerae bacterium]
MKRRYRVSAEADAVRDVLEELQLNTVCTGAHCPNQGECFACGTATFMILGDVCTRNCRFCAIDTTRRPGPPRTGEPQAVAQAARRMGLQYVVVTSVTRDDLPDGGAEHFARTIKAIREELPGARVEVLTPDFRGNIEALSTVIRARPDLFNHNVETVPRLYSAVRPQADYRQSLDVLAAAKRLAENTRGQTFTKSGLMVGLGETPDEVLQVMRDLRESGVDILTIGQYLAPSDEHHPIHRFVTPEEFEQFRTEGLEMGFRAVASGPFVRSSYHAEDIFEGPSR